MVLLGVWCGEEGRIKRCGIIRGVVWRGIKRCGVHTMGTRTNPFLQEFLDLDEDENNSESCTAQNLGLLLTYHLQVSPKLLYSNYIISCHYSKV